MYDFLDENGNDLRSGIILIKENETEQIENVPHCTDKAIGLKEIKYFSRLASLEQSRDQKLTFN